MNINMSFVSKDMSGIVAAQTGLNQLVGVFSNVGEGIARNVGAIDAAVATAGVSLGILATQAAQAYGEFERGQAIVQTVSGSTNAQMQILGQTAQQFSSEFRMGIDDVNEGLTTLGRAGLTDVNNQIETLRQGFSLAKIEGMNLATALEEIVQTTSLLGGDIHSTNFGVDTEKVTNMLVGTSLSGPLNVNDVVQTLKYVGGTAAAAGANLSNEDLLYDLMGTTSAFAQKGVVGSMAGTALRAFLSKPASQDNSVWEGLKEIGLEPYDLWEDGQQEMKPISEQIHIIRQAMKDNNKSTMDQLEIWGKLVGTKMGQQMMKLDEDTIQESTSTIRQKASAETLANKSMQNFASQQEEIIKSLETIWRNYGKTVADVLSPILEIMKPVVDFFANDSSGSKFAIMGIVMVVNAFLGKALGSIREVVRFVSDLISKTREQVSLTKQETTTTEDLLVQNKALTNELQKQAVAKEQIATFSNVDEAHMRYQSSGLSFGKALYMHPDNVNALTSEQKVKNGLLLNDLQTYMQIGNSNKDIEREINAMVQEYYQREVKPWLSAGNTADNFAGYIDANVVDDFLPQTMSMFEGADYDSELQYSIRNEMARQIRNAALYGKLDDNGNVRLRGIGNMIGDAFGGAIYKSGDFSGNIFSYDKALGQYGVLNAKTGNLDTRKDSVTGYFGVSNYGQFSDKPGNPGKALPFMDPNKFISDADGQRRRQETLNRINGNLTNNVNNIARESASINKNIVSVPTTLSSIEASLNTMTNTIRRDTTLETSKASGNTNSSSDYRRSWGGSEKANRLGSSMDSLTTAVYKLKASFDGAFQPYQSKFKKTNYNKVDDEGYELIGYSSDKKKVVIENEIDEAFNTEREYKKGYGVRLHPDTKEVQIAHITVDDEGRYIKEWESKGYMGENASNRELREYNLRRNGEGVLERRSRDGQWNAVQSNVEISPYAAKQARYDRIKINKAEIFKELEGELADSFIYSDEYQRFKKKLYKTKPQNFLSTLNEAPHYLSTITNPEAYNEAFRFIEDIPRIQQKYQNRFYSSSYDDAISQAYAEQKIDNKNIGTVPSYLHRMENLLGDIRKNTYNQLQQMYKQRDYAKQSNDYSSNTNSNIDNGKNLSSENYNPYGWVLNEDGTISDKYQKRIQEPYLKDGVLIHNGIMDEDFNKIDFSGITSARVGIHNLLENLPYDEIPILDEEGNQILDSNGRVKTQREYHDKQRAQALYGARRLLNLAEYGNGLPSGLTDHFVSFDMETAGLNALDPNSKIVEIGFGEFKNGELTNNQASQLIYHPDVGEEYVSKYGSDYNDSLPSQNQVAEGLKQQLERTGVLSGAVPLVGHNIEHDLSFLKEKMGIDISNIRAFDTQQFAKFGFFGNLDSQGNFEGGTSLENVLQKMNIENIDQHHALGDAVATGNLLNTIFAENTASVEANTQAFNRNTNKRNDFHHLDNNEDIENVNVDDQIAKVRQHINDIRDDAYDDIVEMLDPNITDDWESYDDILLDDSERSRFNDYYHQEFFADEFDFDDVDYSGAADYIEDESVFSRAQERYRQAQEELGVLENELEELQAAKTTIEESKEYSNEKNFKNFNETLVPTPVIDSLNSIIDDLPNSEEYYKLHKENSVSDALTTINALFDDENLVSPDALNRLSIMQLALGDTSYIGEGEIKLPNMFTVGYSPGLTDTNYGTYLMAESVIENMLKKQQEYENFSKNYSLNESIDSASTELHSPDLELGNPNLLDDKAARIEKIDELIRSVQSGRMHPWYALQLARGEDLDELHGNPYKNHPRYASVGRRTEENTEPVSVQRAARQNYVDSIDDWYNNPKMFNNDEKAFLSDTHKQEIFLNTKTGELVFGRPKDGNFYHRNLVPVGEVPFDKLSEYGMGVGKQGISNKYNRDNISMGTTKGFLQLSDNERQLSMLFGKLRSLDALTTEMLSHGILNNNQEGLLEQQQNNMRKKMGSYLDPTLDLETFLAGDPGKLWKDYIKYQDDILNQVRIVKESWEQVRNSAEFLSTISAEQESTLSSYLLFDDNGNVIDRVVTQETGNLATGKLNGLVSSVFGPSVASDNAPYIGAVLDILFDDQSMINSNGYNSFVEYDRQNLASIATSEGFNAFIEYDRKNLAQVKDTVDDFKRLNELKLLDKDEGNPQEAYSRYFMRNPKKLQTNLLRYMQDGVTDDTTKLSNYHKVVDFMNLLESEKGRMHYTPEFSKALAKADYYMSEIPSDMTNSRFKITDLLHEYADTPFALMPQMLQDFHTQTNGRVWDFWTKFWYDDKHLLNDVIMANDTDLDNAITTQGFGVLTDPAFADRDIIKTFKQQFTSEFSNVLTPTGMLRKDFFNKYLQMQEEFDKVLQEIVLFMENPNFNTTPPSPNARPDRNQGMNTEVEMQKRLEESRKNLSNKQKRNTSSTNTEEYAEDLIREKEYQDKLAMTQDLNETNVNRNFKNKSRKEQVLKNLNQLPQDASISDINKILSMEDPWEKQLAKVNKIRNQVIQMDEELKQSVPRLFNHFVDARALKDPGKVMQQLSFDDMTTIAMAALRGTPNGIKEGKDYFKNASFDISHFVDKEGNVDNDAMRRYLKAYSYGQTKEFVATHHNKADYDDFVKLNTKYINTMDALVRETEILLAEVQGIEPPTHKQSDTKSLHDQTHEDVDADNIKKAYGNSSTLSGDNEARDRVNDNLTKVEQEILEKKFGEDLIKTDIEGAKELEEALFKDYMPLSDENILNQGRYLDSNNLNKIFEQQFGAQEELKRIIDEGGYVSTPTGNTFFVGQRQKEEDYTSPSVYKRWYDDVIEGKRWRQNQKEFERIRKSSDVAAGLDALFGFDERSENKRIIAMHDSEERIAERHKQRNEQYKKDYDKQLEAKYGSGRGMLTIDQIRTLPAGVAKDSLMKEYMSKLSPFQRFQARIGMSPAVTVDKEGKVQTKGFFERIKTSTGTFGKLGSAVSSVTNMMGGPMMAAMTAFQAVMMLYSKVVEDEQKKITDAETRTSEAQTRYDEAVQNWEASREKADENWSNYSQNDKEQAFIDTMIQGAQQSSLRDNYITWKDPNRYDDLTDAEKKDLETKENSEALSANTRALYLATLSLNAAMQSEDYLKNNSDYTGYYGLQANVNETLLEGSGLQRSGNQFGIYDTFNPEMWDSSDGWIQQLNSLQESFLQFNTRVKNMEDMSTDYMRIAAALDKKNGMNIEQILNSPYEMRRGEKVAWSAMNQEAGMNGTLMARYMKQYEKHLKAFERRYIRLERNQKGGIVLKGGQWKSMLPGLAKAMNVTEQQAKMMVLIHMLSRINEVVQSQIKPLIQETTQSVMQSVMYGKGTTEGTYQNANINAATSGMVNAISSNVATIALQTAHEAAVDAYNIKHPDATVEDFAQLERVANGDDWLYKFNNMFSSTGAGQASAYDVINNPDTGMLRGLATTAASLNSDLKTKEQRDAWIEKWLSKNQLADLGKPKTMHGSQSEFAKYVREHPELNGSISGYDYLTQTWTVGKENLYSKIAEFERAITGEMTPHIADMTMEAMNSALDTENDEGDVGGSGKGSGDKDYDNNNRQRYVQLAICNKKAIPKLNVNLFKKAPSFTVMNKNFKLRDIKINTADKAKNIESAVKNAIIDVQERSDPKIIQDEEAEYDPVGATDGDNLPTGTTQTNNN